MLVIISLRSSKKMAYPISVISILGQIIRVPIKKISLVKFISFLYGYFQAC